MSARKGIILYDSALGIDAAQQLAAIGRADIVIGIPTHRNGRTLGPVLDATIAAIETYLRSKRVVLMNADGGSSDNTVRLVQDAATPSNVIKLLTLYEGLNGKGTGVRAILEAATILEARVCLVLEARMPGLAPEWIARLIEPIMSGYDAAVPCYQRSAYAAALTDNLLYPFMRAFLHTDLRQPLTPEFAVSGEYAGSLAATDVWDTDVSRFGINAWVALQALADERRLAQVDLGVRGDDSGEPGAALDTRILHAVGVVFRLLAVHQRLWQNTPLPRHVPYCGERQPDITVPCTDCTAELLEALCDGRERHGDLWVEVLRPETLERVRTLLARPGDQALNMDVALWRDVALDFALSFNQGEGDPDKVLEALLPLFYARAATYLRATSQLSLAEREAAVDEIVVAFQAAKPAFLERWNSYRSWEDDEDVYWLT